MKSLNDTINFIVKVIDIQDGHIELAIEINDESEVIASHIMNLRLDESELIQLKVKYEEND